MYYFRQSRMVIFAWVFIIYCRVLLHLNRHNLKIIYIYIYIYIIDNTHKNYSKGFKVLLIICIHIHSYIYNKQVYLFIYIYLYYILILLLSAMDFFLFSDQLDIYTNRLHPYPSLIVLVYIWLVALFSILYFFA